LGYPTAHPSSIPAKFVKQNLA